MAAEKLLLRWSEVIAERDATEGWRLTAQQRERYATELAAIGSPDLALPTLRQIALNYHRDQRIVTALRNPQSPEYSVRWERWIDQVQSILQHQGLNWSTDVAVDIEDLTQIALLALQRALAGYAYRSKFSVWTYSVVVQTIWRYFRDSRRLRRAVRPESLDHLTALDPDLGGITADDVEEYAQTRALYAQIQGVLAAQPDRRLRYIFHLAYIEDRRLIDIGEHVQLPPAQVRTLLRQARRVLNGDPTIQAWQHAAGRCEFGCCVEKIHA